MNTELQFIGTIKTPYTRLEECPHNVQHDGPLCQILINEKQQPGLAGLKAGDDILILYWFENSDRSKVTQQVGNGGSTKGTFALRSPHRPNPIAAAEVAIDEIKGGQLIVRGLDCLNGTPLLDIKPAIKR